MEENSTTDRLEIRASAALFTDDELQENIAPGPYLLGMWKNLST